MKTLIVGLGSGNYKKRYMNLSAEITVDADQLKTNFVELNGNRRSQFDTAHICTPKQNTFAWQKLSDIQNWSLKAWCTKCCPNGQHLHMTRKQSM